MGRMVFPLNKVDYLIFISLLLLYCSNVLAQSDLNYSSILKQTLTKNYIQKVCITDLDGDGFDEYIVKVPQAGTNSALRVYDNDFHRIFF